MPPEFAEKLTYKKAKENMHLNTTTCHASMVSVLVLGAFAMFNYTFLAFNKSIGYMHV